MINILQYLLDVKLQQKFGEHDEQDDDEQIDYDDDEPMLLFLILIYELKIILLLSYELDDE